MDSPVTARGALDPGLPVARLEAENSLGGHRVGHRGSHRVGRRGSHQVGLLCTLVDLNAQPLEAGSLLDTVEKALGLHTAVNCLLIRALHRTATEDAQVCEAVADWWCLAGPAADAACSRAAVQTAAALVQDLLGCCRLLRMVHASCPLDSADFYSCLQVCEA